MGMDVKQVKEMTKGAPGSPMKIKAQRGSNVYEVVLERSGGTGTSMASISDASSMQSNAAGQVSKELTASERGKEGSEVAMALHEELDRLRASLATMTGELSKAKDQVQQLQGASSAAASQLAAQSKKQRELEETRAAMDSLQQTLEDARSQHAAEIANLNARADAVLKDLDSATTRDASNLEAEGAAAPVEVCVLHMRQVELTVLSARHLPK